MKKRFSEEQTIGFLKDAEADIPVNDLCRKRGLSDASCRYGGIGGAVAEDLEVENARPKKLLAEAKLHSEALKVVVKGKH